MAILSPYVIPGYIVCNRSIEESIIGLFLKYSPSKERINTF